MRVFFFTTFVLFFALSSAVFAASSVSPNATDISVLPGGTAQASIAFENDDDVVKDYSISLLEAHFGANADALSFTSLPSSLASWITVNATALTLSAGEKRNVTLYFTPGSEVKRGTSTIAVVFSESAPKGGTVTLSSGVSSLLFITVGDDLLSSIKISDVSSSPSYGFFAPVHTMVTLKNDGERILKPRGEIVVRNVFGGSVTTIQVNSEGRRVPPGTSREFVVSFGNSFAERVRETMRLGFGPVTVDARFTSEEGGEKITKSSTIFLFPDPLVSIAALLVLGAVVLFVRRQRSRRNVT